jgi:hypothetical protein
MNMAAMYKDLPRSERSKQPFHFQHQKTEEVPHKWYGAVQKSSYRSPPINLMNGESWFTLPDVNRMPFPKPGKKYAVVNMVADIVTEDGRRPPTSEMYGHHWLLYDQVGTGSGDNLGCGGSGTFVSNIFGAGAELRGVNYDYPNGYGYFSSEGESFFSANLHFINTIDLSAQHFQGEANPDGSALKACIECNWSPGNTGIACKKNSRGNFGCCIDGGRCLTNNMKNRTKTTYYLSYDVYWSTDLSAIKPARTGVIDTFGCGSLGNIEANKASKDHTCNDKICTGDITREIDIDGTLIWAYGHQHVGAINASLYHNGKYICTSVPHYGTDPANPVGNEKGYTTGFDLCLQGDGASGATAKTLKVQKGDKLRVTSLYNVEKVDARILPMPADGYHGGVMGLFYFRIATDGEAVDSYKCQDAKCVLAGGGVPLATCQAAC